MVVVGVLVVEGSEVLVVGALVVVGGLLEAEGSVEVVVGGWVVVVGGFVEVDGNVVVSSERSELGVWPETEVVGAGLAVVVVERAVG